MKIFNEIEINNIGNKKAWEFIGKRLVPSTLTNFFEQGVEFAESQLEELAIDFAEWIKKNNEESYDNLPTWEAWLTYKVSTNTLFQQFIKERNG